MALRIAWLVVGMTLIGSGLTVGEWYKGAERGPISLGTILLIVLPVSMLVASMLLPLVIPTRRRKSKARA